MSVETLSEKTGIMASKLSRILRYLATKHIFCEGNYFNQPLMILFPRWFCLETVQPNVFANNRYSILLHDQVPISAGISWLWVKQNSSKAKCTGWQSRLVDSNEECGLASTKLSEVLRHPIYGMSEDPWSCSLGRVFDVPEGKSFYWVIQGNEVSHRISIAHILIKCANSTEKRWTEQLPFPISPSNTSGLSSRDLQMLCWVWLSM